jgi:Xaa-Pro aminopeptidase
MEKIKKLKKIFHDYKIDGYLIPKNDEFFSEYTSENEDKLKFLTSFTGSYGFALILKKINYLFVDGRYTLQANIQSGKKFKIITIPNKLPSDLLRDEKITIGFDPKLYTYQVLHHYFKKTNCKLIPINQNLI